MAAWWLTLWTLGGNRSAHRDNITLAAALVRSLRNALPFWHADDRGFGLAP